MAFANIKDNIYETFKIYRGGMSRFILPLLVVLDLSASCSVILEQEKMMVRKLYEELTKEDNRAEPFLILAVIQDCDDKNHDLIIAYSGYLKDFDIDAFERNADHCRGYTPLVQMFSESLKYLIDFVRLLDNAKPRPTIPHTMPTVVFLTDYVDNATNDSAVKTIIKNICEAINRRDLMVLEFVLTEKQAKTANVDREQAVHFGGFICRYDNNEISEFVQALRLSSSTITEENNEEARIVPRSDILNYNNMLKNAMYNKMQAIWERKNI